MDKESKEIKLKVDYYKKLISVGNELIEGINYEINYIKRNHGDNALHQLPYRLAKLNRELIEAEMEQNYHEDYYLHYCKRDKDYSEWLEGHTKEANENFGAIIDMAKKIVAGNKYTNNNFILTLSTNAVAEAGKLESEPNQVNKNAIYKVLKEQYAKNNIVWC